jgi:hypothetical protein
VPASIPAGAGMRRHVHPGKHAAESFVSFIPLFDRLVLFPVPFPDAFQTPAFSGLTCTQPS